MLLFVLPVHEQDIHARYQPNAQEYYDLHDPFIDDSELAIDERTYMAQTKQQGFYVSQGEVQLLKDKSGLGAAKGSKPKSSVGGGRDKSVSATEEDGGGKSAGAGGSGTSGKRKKESTGSDEPGFLSGYGPDGRKRRKVDDESLSTEMQALIDGMKEKIAHGEVHLFSFIFLGAYIALNILYTRIRIYSLGYCRGMV